MSGNARPAWAPPMTQPWAPSRPGEHGQGGAWASHPHAKTQASGSGPSILTLPPWGRCTGVAGALFQLLRVLRTLQELRAKVSYQHDPLETEPGLLERRIREQLTSLLRRWGGVLGLGGQAKARAHTLPPLQRLCGGGTAGHAPSQPAPAGAQDQPEVLHLHQVSHAPIF